jgi:hypothetical protein
MHASGVALPWNIGSSQYPDARNIGIGLMGVKEKCIYYETSLSIVKTDFPLEYLFPSRKTVSEKKKNLY